MQKAETEKFQIDKNSIANRFNKNTCNKKYLNYIVHITAKSVIRRRNLFYYLQAQNQSRLCGIFFA